MDNATAKESGLIIKNPPNAEIHMGVQMDGDGIQAPGAIVLCRIHGNAHHPYVAWFHNHQTGGYSGGDYCENLAEGIAAFNDKIERYGAHLVREPEAA